MRVFLIVYCSFVKLYHPILWKQHGQDNFSSIFPFILKFTLEVGNVWIYFDIFRAEKKHNSSRYIIKIYIHWCSWMVPITKHEFFFFLNSVFFQKQIKKGFFLNFFVIMICVHNKSLKLDSHTHQHLPSNMSNRFE